MTILGWLGWRSIWRLQRAAKPPPYLVQYTETQNPLPVLDYVSFAHIEQMGVRSKHSYRYDLVKRGG